MYAEHRLMGNFPARGFGDNISSANFNSNATIFTDKNARIPMDEVPHKHPLELNRVTEAYHVFELHPLSYGQPAVIYSATGGLGLANGGTRPFSYSNAVRWSGEDAPAYVSQGDAFERMLSFSEFKSYQEAWSVGKDVTILNAEPWPAFHVPVPAYQPAAPLRSEFHRALLICYWRAATLQHFGPWDRGARDGCLYQKDQPLQYISARNRTLTICIGEEDNFELLIPQAKGFLRDVLLAPLPAQVRNIASMAAGIPAQHARGIYRDAAACVVLPTDNANFDLRDGAVRLTQADAVLPEEDAFMQEILKGAYPSLATELYARYADATGCSAMEACTFMADYDVLFSAYRLQHNIGNDWQLLCDWYAIDRHLQLRHGLTDALHTAVMAPVVREVLTRLSRKSEQIAAQFRLPMDTHTASVADLLTAFLWEKAYAVDEDLFPTLTQLVVAAQRPQSGAFFPQYDIVSQLDTPEHEQRLATLISAVLNTHYMADPLAPEHVAALTLLAPAHSQSQPIRDVMTDYLSRQAALFPHSQILLLQLTTHYFSADSLISAVFDLLCRERVERPLDAAECDAIRSAWQQLHNPADAHRLLTGYYLALYEKHFNTGLAQLASIALRIGQDTSAFMCSAFTKSPWRELLLHAPQAQSLLGINRAKDTCLLALCADVAAVRDAFLRYLEYHMQRSLEAGEDTYGWYTAIFNAALTTALIASPADKAAYHTWYHHAFVRHTLALAMQHQILPGQEAASRLLAYAQPTRTEIFRQYEGDFKAMYEHLLGQRVSGAMQQALPFIPCFATTADTTHLRAIACQELRNTLCQGWNSQSFWDVLNNSRTTDMFKRCCMPAQDLCNEQTSQFARAALDRDFSMLDSAAAFSNVFGEYRNRQHRFAANISIAEYADERIGLFALWLETLRTAFCSRYENMLDRCQLISEADQLRTTAEQLGVSGRDGVRFFTDATRDCIRRFSRLRNNTSALTLQEAFDNADTLRRYNNATLLRLLRAECTNLLPQVSGFTSRLALSLQACVSFAEEGFHWHDVLHLLLPDMDGMTAKPFAPSSLPLLSVVSAVLGLLESAGMPWCDQFVRYLRTQSVMAAYTAAITKDMNACKLFFPGLNDPDGCVSLRSWLM